MKRLLTLAVVMITVSAVSTAQLALKGIGGGIGYASFSSDVNGSETMSGFLIAAHADLGEFTKGFVFFPDITYASTSKSVEGGTLKLSDFAINVNAHYNIEMQGMLKPYVGAGLGYNSFTSTATGTTPAVIDPFTGTVIYPAQTYTGSVSYSRLGINLLAGVNYPLNDMLTLVVEPRYTIESDFNNFQIKVGVTYAMK